MFQLKPVRMDINYVTEIEKMIKDQLKELIYKPLLAIIEAHTKSFTKGILNANSALYSALIKGDIQYQGGTFSGKFTAAAVKELIEIKAKYNKFKRTFSLPLDDMPLNIRSAIAMSCSQWEKMHADIIGYLDQIRPAEIQLDFEGKYKQIIKDINQKIKISAGDVIGVVPDITENMMSKMAAEYSADLIKYIKDFSAENILQLRTSVFKNTFEGYRAENLVKMIKHSYGVTERKAQFLARQETSLLVSKFRESRYKDCGVNRYKWSTSHDNRVRDRHEALDGKIIDWDNPPIIDEKGRRGHAGEDFGCRCVAIPLLD